jgi:lipopolysaccharide export LptBFGC system permease protein LptF
MQYKLMKNKKGIVWFIPVIIGFLALLVIGGGLTAWKVSQITSSIPTWAWYGIALLIILMLLPKKK